jgi:hypothetical protein
VLVDVAAMAQAHDEQHIVSHGVNDSLWPRAKIT